MAWLFILRRLDRELILLHDGRAFKFNILELLAADEKSHMQLWVIFVDMTWRKTW